MTRRSSSLARFSSSFSRATVTVAYSSSGGYLIRDDQLIHLKLSQRLSKVGVSAVVAPHIRTDLPPVVHKAKKIEAQHLPMDLQRPTQRLLLQSCPMALADEKSRMPLGSEMSRSVLPDCLCPRPPSAAKLVPKPTPSISPPPDGALPFSPPLSYAMQFEAAQTGLLSCRSMPSILSCLP